ncbi:Wzz/FepE/Etk N-terminal domain-containing protein [Campylobacter geochelonis]|uniref:Wzz/FepE/Etk N-terminal domain-containing protein n=1 Tax=Campylobacter geochelonis TaxID=1780362 RepID=UPI0007708107|nr:Wzz/FepE/Etk N-terminal domain-containing protein [Campylobacter geochelonis]CZE49318.1 chain length determinant protein [Campylobacter geochelonis]
MQENINESYKDDEIDLFELIKTLWSYRYKIVVTTACFFILGFIYTLIATPWYKANALVEVGFYRDSQNSVNEIMLAKTSEVVEKLKVKYIDLLKETEDRNEKVQSISAVKNNPKFFNITTVAKSNEEAINLVKKIVGDVSVEHKNTLDGYLNSQKIALANIDRQIEFLKNNRIVEVEQQIKNIENSMIPRLERQLAYLQNNTIPSAQLEVDNINKVSIPAIDKRIDTSTQELAKYEKDLERLKNIIPKTNGAKLTLLYLQEQNLNSNISSVNDRLIYLEQQKEQLMTKTLPDAYNRLDNLRNVMLINSQADIDNIKNDTLPTLQRQLYTLQTQELSALLDKRAIVELSLKPFNYKNTNIVSDIVTSKTPEKPKKPIILAISLMAGFILSVFGVLVYDAFKKRIKNS